jgi:hypothetical protein
VVHPVKELLEVQVHHPSVSRRDVLAGAQDRAVRAATRPEAEAAVRERRVEDRLQNQEQGLLDHPVQHRRDAQSPHAPAVRLRDLHPPDWLRVIRSAEQLFSNARPVFLTVAPELFDVHSIDPWCSAILHHARVRGDHGLATQYLLQEHRSPFPSVLFACRARLTLDTRGLGDSVAYSTGSLWPFSRTLFCVSFVHRTPRAGSAPHVRPFAVLRDDYYGLC